MQRLGVAEFDRGVPAFEEAAFLPKSIFLPLRQHVGAPAKPLVAVGDTVRAGQCVAAADGVISANIHSSVNGTVEAVSPAGISVRVQG